VLVVSAHPDDATLGVGGLVQELHRRGAGFRVVVATEGEAAFPGLDGSARDRLGQVRRAEERAALTYLGLGDDVPVRFLGLPDGRAATTTRIADGLTTVGAGCEWWLVPWRGDPHPDHAAVGEAAARACPAGTHLVEYPVWMRHSVSPRCPGVPLERLRVVHLGRGQRIRKQRAIAAHASQVGVWDAAFDPVLPGHVLALFRGPWEPVFVTAADRAAAGVTGRKGRPG
jgi:LmbE family N-acetylglucosaminyl deacetylase